MIYLDNAATTLRKPAQVYLSLLKNTLFGSVNAGRGGHSMSVRGTEKNGFFMKKFAFLAWIYPALTCRVSTPLTRSRVSSLACSSVVSPAVTSV